MAIKKVIAIIDELVLDAVEDALEAHGVRGFTIHPVKGRGNYCNTFTKNKLVNHSQIELYTSEASADKIASLIMKIADVGGESEGLVAINAVEQLHWVNGQKAASDEEFKFFEVN